MKEYLVDDWGTFSNGKVGLKTNVDFSIYVVQNNELDENRKDIESCIVCLNQPYKDEKNNTEDKLEIRIDLYFPIEKDKDNYWKKIDGKFFHKYNVFNGVRKLDDPKLEEDLRSRLNSINLKFTPLTWESCPISELPSGL